MKRIVWMSVCILLLLAIPAAVLGMPVGDQNATMGPGNVTENVTGNMTANMTVVTVIQQDANLSTLATAIQVANLTETLNGTGPYTVFAPDDEAFAALGNETVNALLNNSTALQQVLMYHVVQGDYTSQDLMNMLQQQNMTTGNQTGGGGVVESLLQFFGLGPAGNATQNATVLQTVGGENVTVEEVNGELMVGNATVVTADLTADNGVVHVINAVLLPPGFSLAPMAENQTQNMTGNQSVMATQNQSGTGM
jgi:uncharacterized surface protein with fasciclin (FAS1) repeats